MDTRSIEIMPGSEMWFEGELVEVRELRADSILFATGTEMRTVATRDFVAHATALGNHDPEPQLLQQPTNVVLSALTTKQREAVETKMRAVRAVLEAAEDQEISVRHACDSMAHELGIPTRTLQRWVSVFRDAGEAGLVSSRDLGRYQSSVDARWDDACLTVLREYVSSSTPTKDLVIDRTARRLDEQYGTGIVPLPSRATAYRRVKELSKGRHAFGSAKQRRSVADRPAGPFGRLRATRPGEYVVLDTTPLDVYAMEAATGRWLPVELTVAQDLYTRCILGLRLTAVSTRSADVANVLFQCTTTRIDLDSEQSWPFHGVPRNVLIGTEVPDGVSQERLAGLPACLPETLITDHGKPYLSAHIIAACARQGISIQPAIPHKPTDKPTIERFFRTLREGLLQRLPGYKGPDVHHRGADVEAQSFYFVEELEQIIRDWVGTIYHRTKHDGLCVPEVPGTELTPAEMFEVGLAKTGGLYIPTDPDLPFQFLDVAWRTIQHYGVDIDGRRYDGDALTGYRNQRSPYGGAHSGKWPILVDSHDVRTVWFQDPETRQYEPLAWEHAAALDQPFSATAAEYVKQLALQQDRFVEPREAVRQLLAAWSSDERLDRKRRATARKIGTRAARGSVTASGRAQPPDVSAVIDLATQRAQRRQLEAQDDVDALFEQYFREHDEIGLEE
ncbi:integrase [Agrococcus sp. Ld7]|uniref:integrase n=1 Tax=Agrococcus sp. Ld7 TaxID=649148 RepID=UPI003870A893